VNSSSLFLLLLPPPFTPPPYSLSPLGRFEASLNQNFINLQGKVCLFSGNSGEALDLGPFSRPLS
jgi:hypothetical protein